jgi:hypothetical protein
MVEDRNECHYLLAKEHTACKNLGKRGKVGSGERARLPFTSTTCLFSYFGQTCLTMPTGPEHVMENSLIISHNFDDFFSETRRAVMGPLPVCQSLGEC